MSNYKKGDGLDKLSIARIDDKVVCALTHNIDVCDKCKKCGDTGYNARSNILLNLIKEFDSLELQKAQDTKRNNNTENANCSNMNKYQEALDNLKFLAYEQELVESIDKNAKVIEELIENYKICRNEMCLICGKYKNEHLDACKGCKFEQ